MSKDFKEALRELRAEWPKGPWDDEPEQVDFEASGYACALRRNFSGAWCGYVGIPATNPLFGLDYNQSYSHEGEKHSIEGGLNVHGGITYAGRSTPNDRENPDLWWFGFDCHHCYDAAPGMFQYMASSRIFSGNESVYRTAVYAEEQTRKLALQLREIEQGHSRWLTPYYFCAGYFRRAVIGEIAAWLDPITSWWKRRVLRRSMKRYQEAIAWEYVGVAQWKQKWLLDDSVEKETGKTAVYINHELKKAKATGIGAIDYNALAKDRQIVVL